MDYSIIREEKEDSLEKLLYIFVCNDNKELDKLYLGNEIMEKVRERISALTDDFYKDLYYNREEYLKEMAYLEAKEEKAIEIAKAMLKDNVEISTIIKYTGLSDVDIERMVFAPLSP